MSPRTISGLPSKVVAVAGGGNHSCFSFSDGTMRCVGRGHVGQLGDGKNTMTAQDPVTVVRPAP